MAQEERILRLENAMSTLAEGSVDYNRRVSRIEESFVMLVEMVRRHGERLDESSTTQDDLRAAQAELTAAQANSEAKIEALADAQIRTEDALRDLREAQADANFKLAALADSQLRTEESLRNLKEAQANSDVKLAALIDIVRDERNGRPPKTE